jgi:hypothetical protein
VKVIVFERLIAHPQDVMREIFDFLNEPRFAPAAEVFAKRINSSLSDNVDWKVPIEISRKVTRLYEMIREGELPATDQFGLSDFDSFEQSVEDTVTAVERALS